ncbi:hypothetical protein CR513_24939, partial [Mucuna pruriens]
MVSGGGMSTKMMASKRISVRLDAKIVTIKFIIVNAWASYNMILGRLALTRLQEIMSTPHLCMKYLVQGGRTDEQEDEWPNPYPLLRFRSMLESRGSTNRPKSVRKNEDWGALKFKMERQLIRFLLKNRDVFTWSPEDMPGIDPNFLYHHLSFAPRTCPMSQKKRNLEEEKRIEAKEETSKLLATHFIREV